MMFHSRIFGRKPPATPSLDQARYRSLPEARSLSYDALAERATLSLIGKQTDIHSWNRALMERLAGLNPVERGEVFVSLAPYADAIDKTPSRDTPDQDEDRKRLCFTQCHFKAYEIALEDVRDYVALITGASRHTTSHYAARGFVKQLKKAIAAGGFLTSHECALLAAYAEGLRAARAYQRADKKAYAELSAAIDKIAGVEQSTASILLDRCEDAETGRALGDLPEHYDFWCAVLAATAGAMNGLRRDLCGKTRPVWMADRAAFAAAFPPAGPFVPRFGQWNTDGEATRDFAFLRNLKRTEPLAEPERYLTLRDAREIVAPMIRYAWNTAAIPGVERFGDLESPKVTELLDLFVTAKGGPRPTATWAKSALKIAGAVGIEEVEARLHDWLALFHTPCGTPAMLADAMNCQRMDRIVVALNTLHPDWPTHITPDDIDRLGRALALNLATGNPEELKYPWMASLFQFDDHVYKGRRTFAGRLRLPSGGTRDWHVTTTQLVSIENEQVLRAVIWLLPSLPDSAAATVTLEKTALAAACRMGGGSDAIRSKTAANAAIAALVALDSDMAGLALLRLSKQIDDRTITAPIVTALKA